MEQGFFGNISFKELVQYIEGSVDEFRKHEIGQWINSDPRRKDFYIKLSEAWLNPGEIKDLRKEQLENDWNIITSRISNTSEIKPDKNTGIAKSHPGRDWLRVAAAVLFILSVAGAYFAGKGRKRAAEGIGLSYYEVFVPKGQRSQITLSDGSTVWINAESKLRFPNSFGGDTREVWIDGEAFFDIEKDSLRPFYVHTSDLTLKVYGTKFNVKAYGDEDLIETTLVEGSVSFRTNERGDDREVFLEPNHKAIYLKSASEFVSEEITGVSDMPIEPNKLVISNPIEVEPVISWTEGRLVFDNESFGSIAAKLERKYDIQIAITDNNIQNIKYTGVLKNISLEQALKAIQLSMPIEYTIKEKEVTISRKPD